MTPTTTQPNGNILDSIVNYLKNNQTIAHLMNSQQVPQTTPGIAPTPNGQGLGASLLSGLFGPAGVTMTPAQNSAPLQKAVDAYMKTANPLGKKKAPAKAINPQAVLAKATNED